MDKLLAWLKSEPAILWTTAGAAVCTTIQTTSFFDSDTKNWLTLGITLVVGIIIRGSVTPLKGT